MTLLQCPSQVRAIFPMTTHLPPFNKYVAEALICRLDNHKCILMLPQYHFHFHLSPKQPRNSEEFEECL